MAAWSPSMHMSHCGIEWLCDHCLHNECCHCFHHNQNALEESPQQMTSARSQLPRRVLNSLFVLIHSRIWQWQRHLWSLISSHSCHSALVLLMVKTSCKCVWHVAPFASRNTARCKQGASIVVCSHKARKIFIVATKPCHGLITDLFTIKQRVAEYFSTFMQIFQRAQQH